MLPLGAELTALDPASLTSVASWPGTSTVGLVAPDGKAVTVGPTDRAYPWASLTKILAALAVLVAVEEGTVTLDSEAGPPGATIRHLLSHASGVAPDDDTILASPATRRIYSNRGIELALGAVARGAATTWEDYLAAAVLEPLAMGATTVTGSPAYGATGPLADLVKLAAELQSPTLVAPATLALATTPAWPDLAGVLPGFGRQDPNPWGLGLEIRGHKDPHWTAVTNSPDTFGHFGAAGSFLWVDPQLGMATAALGDRPFGPWATQCWPRLAAAVVAAHQGGRPGPAHTLRR